VQRNKVPGKTLLVEGQKVTVESVGTSRDGIERMFDGGTIIPISGQNEAVCPPGFGCKLLNNSGLDWIREGQAACDFQR